VCTDFRVDFRAGHRLPQTGLAMGLAAPGAAFAALEWNLQTPVTPVARQMYDLHSFIFWVCVVIFIAVFGVMFYSIFRHRKSVGHEAHQFHENTTVEVIWTVIPFLILLFVALPATKTILALKDTTEPGVTIKVTGYQWKWGYDYLQEGIGFYSNLATPLAQIENRAPKGENYLLEVDNPMVVPVDTKIRVLITASDVLHAWWVPAFGVKQDAIPGFVRDSWFEAQKPGIYRGQCAELCGKEHGFMPIVVEVKSKEDYAKWIGDQKTKVAAAGADPNKVWDMKELVARGEKVYAANCSACHQATGKGVAWLFTGDAMPAPEFLAQHPGLVVARVPAGALAALPGGERAISLIDPLGNLVLRYPGDPDINGIAKDLSRLLRASRIG
jgi:cytochrome c oxidase subunit 2